MVKPVVRMLASSISHMPLLTVWRDSGVTERHGFKLEIEITAIRVPTQPYVGFLDRTRKLINGDYDFVSGLHHEPYQMRAKGDKRLMYLAQAQNDWDDRVIAGEGIQSAADLEGKKVMTTTTAPCVLGNLKHSIELGGAELDRIEFVIQPERSGLGREAAIDMVVSGEVAAVNVDAPWDLRGEKHGLHRLDMPSVPVIHNVTLTANQDWVDQNEETTVAFIKSMIDAIHFFKTEPSKTCDILERNLAPLIGLEGPDEVAHLQEVWAGLLSAKPYPHPLAVWNVYSLDVGHDPAVNFIEPFEIWDTSYLRSIDAEGYIEALYGGARKAINPHVTAAI